VSNIFDFLSREREKVFISLRWVSNEAKHEKELQKGKRERGFRRAQGHSKNHIRIFNPMYCIHIISTMVYRELRQNQETKRWKIRLRNLACISTYGGAHCSPHPVHKVLETPPS
jgi:hypothetical protein